MSPFAILTAALLTAQMLPAATTGMETVTLPGKSPIVTFRFVFRTGAASDPADKPGLAALTAAMLGDGGSKDLTYKQVLDALFPMAASISQSVDKEMTVFTAETHVDNLDAFYKIFRGLLLEPGWREEDLKRLRDDAINYLRVSLRGNNDEELGKEMLYNQIYAGTPYGHENIGAVSALEKLTMADLQDFYRRQYTGGNLIIGLAGGYPKEFLARVQKDFAKLPAGPRTVVKAPDPKPVNGNRVLMIEKQTRSVAYSFGFPIEVKRGHPDYPALLLANTYLGPHRVSGGHLFQRMREDRGLNYGDYSYIEYFPFGMYLFEPTPNLARQQQIFQIWIRPVEPPTAVFALRLALYELDHLIRGGMDPESFERTRNFLSKNVNLLTKTKNGELGYAIDSRYYGIPDYNGYLKTSLAKLTVDDVNRAIRKHLRPGNLDIVVVASGCEALKQNLLSGAPSPMTYNSPKPQELLDEDKIVEKWDLKLKAGAISIVPVKEIFE